ncbi:hypothetical protein Tco_1104902 [Tanacetum coccineum]
MSTSSAHQQSLVDAGSETRPLMLERGSYIPWEIQMIQHDANQQERPKTEDNLTGDNLKQYEAGIKAMNLILIYIPNDIHNSMDSCQTTKETWLRVKRLMQGTELSEVHRETRFNNELINSLGNIFQNDPEDPLTSAMMLLARAITQPEMLEMMIELQDDHILFKKNMLRVAIAKGHYALDCPKPRVWDSKYFIEQIFLAKKDEVGDILSNEQNDFFIGDATQLEEIE